MGTEFFERKVEALVKLKNIKRDYISQVTQYIKNTMKKLSERFDCPESTIVFR